MTWQSLPYKEMGLFMLTLVSGHLHSTYVSGGLYCYFSGAWRLSLGTHHISLVGRLSLGSLPSSCGPGWKIVSRLILWRRRSDGDGKNVSRYRLVRPAGGLLASTTCSWLIPPIHTYLLPLFLYNFHGISKLSKLCSNSRVTYLSSYDDDVPTVSYHILNSAWM